MIKFWVTTRPPAGVDREVFDYQWGVVHTSLMVTTPSVVNGNFKRYTQHRSVLSDAQGRALNDAALMYRRSAEGWYSCADHMCEAFEDIVASVLTDDVKRRVFNFRFSDKAMVVELTDTKCIFDSVPSRLDAGGVKLINHLHAVEGVSQADFTAWWRSEYALLMRELTGSPGGPVHRYDQNASVPVDPAFFSGSLFELGNAGTYSGIEELWFDDLAAVYSMGDPAIAATLAASASPWVDAERSFSMVAVERVVFDSTGAFPDAVPSVRVAGSVEQRMAQSERGWDNWNQIRVPYSEKVAGQ